MSLYAGTAHNRCHQGRRSVSWGTSRPGGRGPRSPFPCQSRNASAAALDAWHAAREQGPRPPGRLRRHTPAHEQVEITFRRRWITGPAYRMVLDPDGRPLRARLQRTY